MTAGMTHGMIISERVQRRTDRLLDDAEEAADRHDWVGFADLARRVLIIDDPDLLEVRNSLLARILDNWVDADAMDAELEKHGAQICLDAAGVTRAQKHGLAQGVHQVCFQW
jgi:hypothetical protein